MRVARPGGGGDRVQAGSDIAAQERGELVDGEARKRRLPPLLEIAGERATEIALDQRPAQRTQVVAAGADPIESAVEMGILGERLRAIEPQIELVGGNYSPLCGSLTRV